MTHSNPVIQEFLSDNSAGVALALQKVLATRDANPHAQQVCRYIIKNKATNLWNLVASIMPLDAMVEALEEAPLRLDTPLILRLAFDSTAVRTRAAQIAATKSLNQKIPSRMPLDAFRAHLSKADPTFANNMLLVSCVGTAWIDGVICVLQHSKPTPQMYMQMLKTASAHIKNPPPPQYWAMKTHPVTGNPMFYVISDFMPSGGTKIDKYNMLGFCEALVAPHVRDTLGARGVEELFQSWDAQRQQHLLMSSVETIENRKSNQRKL